VRSENRKEIKTAAQNIENAATEKKPGSELLMTGSFIRLMVYINRLSLDQSGMQGMISDEKIDAVIAYINENFKKNISVSDLADKFHISRSYLMHRFKDVTGGSVHNFITQKRLNLALSMLRDGTPAMEAALVCGFSDYTVFYKSFRKTFGYSPADALAKH
jgi:AraC-like DNA-binding protein